MTIEPIPLPPFTLQLLGGAAAVFVVCAFILITFRSDRPIGAIGSALLPFAIPAGVTAFIVLIVASIGVALLLVGKVIAVPLAMVLAVIVLVVCSLMARSGSASTSTQAQH